MEMSAVADIFMRESQLFRAAGAPTAADDIRNPGYRPTYSCRLARPMSAQQGKQAFPAVQPQSGTFTQKKSVPKLGTDHIRPQPPCFPFETSTKRQRTDIRDSGNGERPWKPT